MDMSKKVLAAILAFFVLLGCQKTQHKEVESKPAPADSSGSERKPSERDQLESEVREGGLKDPGGAKSLREESADQQKEQQEQAEQVDEQ